MDDALRMDDDLDRRRAGTPNSQCASMTSRPLFIIVAESTLILRPMTQFGMRAGLRRRDRARAPRAGASRNGPPDAVSTMRRTPAVPDRAGTSAGRHWKIALCSLSIGSSVAPPASTAAMKAAPPITSASLFASRMRLPARAAASVGARPAAPTMAASTVSASGNEAASTSPASPATTRVAAPPRPAPRSSARAAPGSSSAASARPVAAAQLRELLPLPMSPPAPRPRSDRDGARSHRASSRRSTRTPRED